MPPLVSIITPSLNQARYLERTMESVLSQDYAGLEYIVVDGGSTDGSPDLIRRHAGRLAAWVSEPDGGQAEAINKGLRLARGDILNWINSDDQLEPGAVRHAVEVFQAHPEADLAYADCAYVDEHGRTLQLMRAWEFAPRRLLTGIPLVIQPASFFTRRALDRVGLLDESLHYVFDHDFYVRLALAGLAFQQVDAVWARFRLHAASKTLTQWIKFNLELQHIVERTFAQESPRAPRAWHAEGQANVWQWLGEAYLKDGQRSEARQALLNALRARPLRPKSLMALALLVDATLGTRLALAVRQWRYRLPDAPRGAQPLREW